MPSKKYSFLQSHKPEVIFILMRSFQTIYTQNWANVVSAEHTVNESWGNHICPVGQLKRTAAHRHIEFLFEITPSCWKTLILADVWHSTPTHVTYNVTMYYTKRNQTTRWIPSGICRVWSIKLSKETTVCSEKICNCLVRVVFKAIPRRSTIHDLNRTQCI